MKYVGRILLLGVVLLLPLRAFADDSNERRYHNNDGRGNDWRGGNGHNYDNRHDDRHDDRHHDDDDDDHHNNNHNDGRDNYHGDHNNWSNNNNNNNYSQPRPYLYPNSYPNNGYPNNSYPKPNSNYPNSYPNYGQNPNYPPRVQNSPAPSCPAGTRFDGQHCVILDNSLRKKGGDGNINPCPKGYWMSNGSCVPG